MSHPTLLHRWFDEVWNQARTDSIAEMMTEDAILNGLNDENGNPHRGPVGFEVVHKRFLEAFPDIQISIREHVASEGKEAICCTCTGTHRGPFHTFAPTGKKVTFSGMCMVRVVNGRIVEAWNNFDILGLQRQIAVLPEGE